MTMKKKQKDFPPEPEDATDAGWLARNSDLRGPDPDQEARVLGVSFVNTRPPREE